jgi:hypothetical protein
VVGWDWVHLVRGPLVGLFYQPWMMDGECAAVGRKIGRGNWSTCRKPAPVSLCRPQIPHDLTQARTRPPRLETNDCLSYGTALYLNKHSPSTYSNWDRLWQIPPPPNFFRTTILAPSISILLKLHYRKSESESELHCDWRSVSQYVLVSSPNMGLLTRYIYIYIFFF